MSNAKLKLFLNKSFLLTILLIHLSAYYSYSQNISPGYNHDYIYLLESSTPRIQHSSIKPFRSEQFRNIEDSLNQRFIGDSTNSLKNALLNNAMLEVNDEKSSWMINPILDLNITLEKNAQDAIWFNQLSFFIDV